MKNEEMKYEITHIILRLNTHILNPHLVRDMSIHLEWYVPYIPYRKTCLLLSLVVYTYINKIIHDHT